MSALNGIEKGKLLSVQVRKVDVRTSPSFLSKITQQLQYGHQVTVISDKNDWIKVENNGRTGWLHSSALTSKKIVLREKWGAQGNIQADDDEITLAGKGFNKEVEDRFRSRNKNVDFTWVDITERYVTSSNDIRKFLKAGDLQPEENQ